MKTSESIDQLAKALAAAQGEIKNATLNKTNPHFKSRYADLAAIRDACIPALSKNGIAVVQGTSLILHGETQCILCFTKLMHTSGQWITSDYPLPLSPDKPQIMGSAYTYARRYSLAAICGIAAEEDDDGNQASAKTNGGTKPAGPAGYIGGEMDAPKRLPKKDARETYDKLQAELYANQTQVSLKEWGKAAAGRIHIMPEDWEDIIRLKYDEYMLHMKQRDGISLNDVTEAG